MKRPADSQGTRDVVHRRSVVVRSVVSVLVSLHVAAVFIGPFGIEPTSPLAAALRGWFAPYIQAVDLDHGYKYFAPEVGPSHLVRYVLSFDDGRANEEATFPDRQRQRPRLLYHRYFMLSEWLWGHYAPPQPPAEIKDNREAVDAWARERHVYEAYCESFATHLLVRSGARTVTLYRTEHRWPWPDEVRGGLTLSDSSLYETHLVGTYRRDAQ
jgi:hypothetical protein